MALEIIDTGLNTDLQQVFTRAHDDWMKILSGSVRMEDETLTTNDSAPRKNSDGLLIQINNNPESINPTRLTITGRILATDYDNNLKLLNMRRTQGLKKLRGIDLFRAMYQKNTDNEIYVHIKSVKTSNVLVEAKNYIGLTIQAEVVNLNT